MVAKQKFYAVKVGRNPGIYQSWSECEEQVKGFSGAIYKSFASRGEAEKYLSSISEKKVETRKEDAEAVAYVDGSYDDSKKVFAAGVVIFWNDIEKHFSGKSDDVDLIEMRNVAGEIKASEYAMQYCLENNIHRLDLYHDYEGIAKWCTGEWSAKKKGTQDYRDFYESIKDRLDVNFIKVKGHSGDKYNDLADKLAKEALEGDEIIPKNVYNSHVNGDVPSKETSKKSVKVYLDRNKMPQMINNIGEELWGNLFRHSSFEKLGDRYRYHFSVENIEQSLDFFYNKNGTVTISNVGANVQYAEKLKEEINKKSIKKSSDNTNCTFSGVSIESYNELIDFLKIIENIDLLEQKEIDNPKHEYLKFKSKFGDSMVINRYETGKVLFQGTPAYIMAQAMCFMAQKSEVKEEELAQNQAELYQTENVTISDSREILRQRLPYAYDKLDDLILKMMSPSISLSKSNIVMEEYCCYVFPVLKALEAFLKQLFLEKHILLNNKKGFGQEFIYNSEEDWHHLNQNNKERINDDRYVECIEKIYYYFRNSRHVYFHANQILAMSSMIEDKKEADTIISDVLELIEETAKMVL